MTRTILHLLTLLSTLTLTLHTQPTLSKFTTTTCWSGSNLCIQQNAAGTWCYIPQAGDTRYTTCPASGADLSTVLDVHLHQGLSIAYYNAIGNEFLGGANYSLPASHGVIRLCVSGMAGDGGYETLCVNASADNVLTGSPYCQVAVPQVKVTDGCYEPDAQARVVGGGTGGVSATATGPNGYPTSYTGGPSYTSAARPSRNGPQAMLRVALTALVLILCLY